MAKVMAERLWKTKAITLADVVETTYDGGTRELITVLRIVSVLGVTASQLLAMGLIGQVIIPGISFQLSTFIMTAVIVGYTYAGGLMAVALTDVVQMILNALGVMVLLPLIGLIKIGGWQGLSTLPANFFNPVGMGWSFVFTMFVFAFPGTFVSQEIWVRMFAAKSSREAKLALNLASLCVYLPYAMSVAVVGLVGAKLFPGLKSDVLIPHMVSVLIPGFMGSVILASLLAAVMSCADSVLLVGASNISYDIYKKYINPKVSEKNLLFLSRICVLVVGAAALGLALTAKGIIDLMTKINTPLTAIGPVILLGFYWKRATALGAKLAILSSVAIGIPMLLFGVKILGQDPLVITFLVSVSVAVLVGLLTPKRPNAASSPSNAD